MQVHRCSFFDWIPQGTLNIQFNPSKTVLAVGKENGSIELWRRLPYLYLERVCLCFYVMALASSERLTCFVLIGYSCSVIDRSGCEMRMLGE